MQDQLPIPIAKGPTQAQQVSIVNLVRRTAKAEILPRFKSLSSAEIREKSGPQDLVTEADLAAEAMIARGLRALFPTALVVGEEAIAEDAVLRDKIDTADLAFIIDPVDGTWNFAHGLGLFGVILAATRFGKPIFGMLYDPIRDDWIIGCEERPTRIVRANGVERSVKVGAGGDIGALSGFVHASLMPDAMRAEVYTALSDFSRAHSLRCSCHEYRLLTRGAVDFCLSSMLNPWDHAAGAYLTARAGGHVAFLDGQPYSTEIREGFLLSAANEATWERLKAHFSMLNPKNDAVPAPDTT